MENKFNGLHQKIILTDILRKKSMSIAQLLRETGMKRAEKDQLKQRCLKRLEQVVLLCK